ncbi:MAG: DUF4097 family beta strand repeat-containing protein [Pyrinomonadaceae bacterium]
MSWLYSLVFAGMLFAGGPDRLPSAAVTNVASPAPAASRDETERIERSFAISPNGRVSVANVNGSITVNAWDRSEVRIVAIKSADTKERLADVEIKIDARPDRVAIETDHGRNGQVWRQADRVVVDYQIDAPRGAVLNEIETVNGSVTVADFTNVVKISTVNGSVKATNLRGTASLSTVNGEVAADFDRLEPASKVSLSSVNGRVSLTIPSDANATVKADSVNGPISNDWGLPVRKGQYVGRDLYGRIGSGEVQIKLDSVNGPLAIKRRSDGRSLSPATNLLNQKPADDWDDEAVAGGVEPGAVVSARERAKLRSEIRKAQAEVRREMAKVDREALKQAAAVLDDKKIGEQIRAGLEQQRAALAGVREAMFAPGVPRVVSKSGTFAVKGVPKITVEAKGCSVRVRGWDKPEVKYAVTQYSSRPTGAPINVSDQHSDSAVTIKVLNTAVESPLGVGQSDLTGTRVDVFVPRRSNLKISSDGEIRLDGVTGDIEVAGTNEAINIRDSGGKLTLSNVDGIARVVGFTGDVEARSSDGDIYLEGDLSSIDARSGDGEVILTLPESANLTITSNTEVRSEGLRLVRREDAAWQLGTGVGPKYRFNFSEGRLVVRGLGLLASN